MRGISLGAVAVRCRLVLYSGRFSLIPSDPVCGRLLFLTAVDSTFLQPPDSVTASSSGLAHSITTPFRQWPPLRVSVGSPQHQPPAGRADSDAVPFPVHFAAIPRSGPVHPVIPIRCRAVPSETDNKKGSISAAFSSPLPDESGFYFEQVERILYGLW